MFNAQSFCIAVLWDTKDLLPHMGAGTQELPFLKDSACLEDHSGFYLVLLYNCMDFLTPLFFLPLDCRQNTEMAVLDKHCGAAED